MMIEPCKNRKPMVCTNTNSSGCYNKHSSWKRPIALYTPWILLLFAIAIHNTTTTVRLVNGLSLSASNRNTNRRNGGRTGGSGPFSTRRDNNNNSSSSSSGRPNPISTRKRPEQPQPTPTTTSSTRTPRDNEKTIVILYHKPPNVITSHESQDDRSTVYEDIQSMRGFLPARANGDDDDDNRNGNGNVNVNGRHPSSVVSFEEATGIRSKLHAIGRLDADTTGLLLLTNDGRLVHHVTNPTSETHDHERYNNDNNNNNNNDGTKTKTASKIIDKTYEALIMGHHTTESLEPLRRGVDIGKNCVTQPLLREDDLRILDHPNHKSTVVSITIGEGKNRQVRKMFHAIGSGVMKLRRTRIGTHLALDGVNEGEWRLLTDGEVQRFLDWNPRELPSLPARSPQPNHKPRRRGGPGPSKTTTTKRRRRRRQ